MHEFDYDLQPHREVPEKVQQIARQATLVHHEERSAQMKALTSRLKQQGSEYAQELRSIIGSQKLKRLCASRSADVGALLTDAGVDIDRMNQFKAEHTKKARLLNEYDKFKKPDAAFIAEPPPCQGTSDSWVVYSPPYPGFFWSYEWSRSDEPDDPVLTRYLDQSNGQIGSSIHTRLSGADDDDFVNVDYYTAFKLWHQVRETGHLEAYLAFRVTNLNYSRTTSDEWGFSSFVLSQFTRPQLRILAPDETWEIKSRLLYNIFEHDQNVFHFVEWVFPTSDIHWFYFKSDQRYSAGSWVLLEAALQNIAWFEANDYSITEVNDVDLRLDRIAVRSIPDATG
ncbi:MAG: hypothetical protein GY774_37685 [Planctomycetes bacterium]|nr:hypothetical protein [Planctomycetota bacterium]